MQYTPRRNSDRRDDGEFKVCKHCRKKTKNLEENEARMKV